jgi:benzil reductase ((S)-benzoin forming)
MESRDLAIVTGGSKGLGAALCRRFLDKGYQVVEFSRSGTADYNVPIDLADPKAAEKAFSRLLSRLAMNEYNTIVGVNNAGVLSPIGPAARKPLEEVVENMNVNFLSQVLFIRSFLKNFQKP